MTRPYYFGFGSLVNDQTLPKHARWQRATVRGWRRSWRHPIPGKHRWAAMDVIPDPEASIEGLLLVGNDEIDSYLIQRESGYQSRSLDPGLMQVEHELPVRAAPCLWTSKSPALSSEELHLMQSYVDVVMSGYLRNFGEEGLQRFVQSTDNWELPVIDDRENPVYPRAVELSTQEQQIIKSLQPTS